MYADESNSWEEHYWYMDQAGRHCIITTSMGFNHVVNGVDGSPSEVIPYHAEHHNQVASKSIGPVPVIANSWLS
jgi:hypothetical protein